MYIFILSFTIGKSMAESRMQWRRDCKVLWCETWAAEVRHFCAVSMAQIWKRIWMLCEKLHQNMMWIRFIWRWIFIENWLGIISRILRRILRGAYLFHSKSWTFRMGYGCSAFFFYKGCCETLWMQRFLTTLSRKC